MFQEAGLEIKFSNFPLEVSRSYSGDIVESDLPPRYNRRWTSAMKAKVIAAIECGLLTSEEAGRRYNLGEEELAIWHRGISRAVPEAGVAKLQRSLHRTEDSSSLGGLIDLRL